MRIGAATKGRKRNEIVHPRIFRGVRVCTRRRDRPGDAQQPKRGGTLKFAISAETPHYDCHGSDTYATLHFSAPFYSTLLKFNLDKYPDVKGDLAESWTVAPDQMTYTFKLHSGVKFHDGTPLTSADVKATYDRLRNPPQGVVSTRQATFRDIGSIETPDPLTVVFKMKAVNASMLEHFACPWNCIYAAKDLTADPNAPKTKINGTGPFTFVEHVKGSHVSGKQNPDYFKKGLPYLDGFKGIFTLQAAAMLNALQGGQVLAEFRGVSPAERDRLVQAMGDKIRIEELSWTLNLLVAFNSPRKAVRRRARAQGAVDGDRSLGRQPGPVAHLDAALGRRRDPSRLADRDAGGRAREASGLLQGHQGVARGSEEAAGGGGRAEPEIHAVEPQSRDALYAGRHLPGRPVAADRRRGRAQAVRHRAYLATMNAGNYDVAIDFSNLFMDDPSLALAKYLSLKRAPENRSRANDDELDRLYDAQCGSAIRRSASDLIQAFEKRLFEQAYQQPLLWWHRIVPTHKAVMGWKMSPSHNLGADLSEVWLNQ